MNADRHRCVQAARPMVKTRVMDATRIEIHNKNEKKKRPRKDDTAFHLKCSNQEKKPKAEWQVQKLPE